MTDVFTKEKRSEVMSKIRGKDTKMELLLRSELWKRGCRYRKHHGEYQIDIAFPSRKIAIFLDGCFWHGCPEHYRAPKTNGGFWQEKIERNVKRDAEATKSLEDDGWAVLRFWEHELRKKNLPCVVERIEGALKHHESKINPSGWQDAESGIDEIVGMAQETG